MASKKLAPRAGRLTNPAVGVRGAKRSTSDGDGGADARGPADRDGNEQQARQKHASARGENAAPEKRAGVARRRTGS